ncbi:hypothetical protein SDC9_11339 [bioreactor metagenome]|uniref:Integral membrane protein TerC family protein n=1 Tax=bioreactor metagenome TaxID=1076179 RepID=A0A644TFD0_9ZZZZ|nr:TerC family protein [Negativicutes bacterium]
MDYILAVLGIIVVNILLSGDNALVIALASRNLSAQQQKQAMLWGSAGAVVLRIVLTFGAVLLLQIPYLQLVGGIMLVWIAAKLVRGEKQRKGNVVATGSLTKAIKTIITADVIMSLDNVLAIAGVAKGDWGLLVLGLAISVPLIVWGSQAIGMLVKKWPIIIIIGAAFLGWTGGEMVIVDTAVLPFAGRLPWLHWILPGAFAVIAVGLGKMVRNHQSVN